MKKRLLSLCLAFILIFSCCFATFTASAKSSDVEAAQSLAVYIIQNGEKQLLHEYSIEEMQDLSDGQEIYYSSLDQLPTTVLTVASGVYLKDLFDDLSNYTDKDLKEFMKLKFVSSDNWTRTYTSYSSLMETRYYYESLFEDGVVEGGKIVGNVGEGVPVKPMLAIWAWQKRVPVDAQWSDAEINYTSDCERFRLCFGMSKSEIKNSVKTNSEMGRGIYQIEITLPDDEPAGIAVTGLTLNKTSAVLDAGSQTQLIASVLPQNATNQELTWESSNTSIATVNSSGLVKALKAGTATITVTSEDGGYSQSCRITVNSQDITEDEVFVTGVSLNRSKATITVDDQLQLKATVSPLDASNDSVVWKSSKESVATVNQSGKVTAHKEGTATITVTTDDGEYTDTCLITVQDTKVEVDSISIQPESISLQTGGGYQLKAILKPEDCTNDNVTWNSSNTAVATVNSAGYVTAIAPGSTQINAVSDDGGFIASCQVTVSAPITFSDVNASHWFYNYVTSLAQLKIINGYPDGSFQPDAYVTCGEALKLILLAAGIQPNAYQTHWADGYQSRAMELGILEGQMDLDAAINRLEVAQTAAKALSLNLENNSAAFADIDNVYVNALYAANIIEGSFDEAGQRVFKPDDTIKRSEISAIIYRINQMP